GGSIINIGSIYGQVSSDKRIYGDSKRNNSEVYSATKAGIIQFTKYLATHWAEYNIRVNCISPGGIFNNQKEFFVKNYINKVPLGRMANVTDINGALIFLASDASKYVTGQNLTIDGGFTIW
ncbi:MAG: SDR family oxidoreductase, partial [Nanoarchaeota archaeon]